MSSQDSACERVVEGSARDMIKAEFDILPEHSQRQSCIAALRSGEYGSVDSAWLSKQDLPYGESLAHYYGNLMGLIRTVLTHPVLRTANGMTHERVRALRELKRILTAPCDRRGTFPPTRLQRAIENSLKLYPKKSSSMHRALTFAQQRYSPGSSGHGEEHHWPAPC